MSQTGTKATFWRGGTSNGLLINGADLPAWRNLSVAQKADSKTRENALQPFFDAAMGSPDPYCRQLNGMGGGVSSLSKAVIIEKSSVDSADLDYWFVQIGMIDGKIDTSGNCGNISSAVAPFALNTGLLDDPESKLVAGTSRELKSASSGQTVQNRTMSVKLRNMNTNKHIKIDMQVSSTDKTGKYQFEDRGAYSLDGVPGKTSPITLTFLDPAGSKTGKALPTGNPVDTLVVDGKEIKASLVDISNPGVFIDGRDVGHDPSLKPDQLTANTELMTFLLKIRKAGAVKMGLDPNIPGTPIIVLVYPPHQDDVDIRCQALSMGQAHKAFPATISMNVGVNSKLKGTIPNQLARQRDPSNTVIAHPSGKLEVGADIQNGNIVGAKLVRSARWLMDGVVNGTYGTPADDWAEV